VNLISIDGISKTLGEAPLFESLSLGIDSGEKLGLVGKNGVGKSTLFKVLIGQLEPDSGSIARKRGLSVSFLAQRPVFEKGETLRGFLRRGESTGAVAFARYEALLARGGDKAAEREAAALRAELESSGDIDLEHRYLSLCSELGLGEPDALLSTFSGGMLKKAAIARCLAPASELILLDEPTNHLDIETIEWLERRLSSGGPAFVLITHDRYFLDSVCTSILEMEGGKVYRHPGNYSAYLERKAERWASEEKADSRRLANLKIELEWLHRGARARAGKSRRRKEKIRDMAASGKEEAASMEGFQTGERRLGRKILELKNVSKGYDGSPVISGLSYEFTRGDRVGVVGPNGAGKTTLLDLVVGRKAVDSGLVDRGETLHFAYFDQTSAQVDLSVTVVDYVKEHAELIRLTDGTVLTAEQLLERFLFPKALQSLRLSRLSGGELRRLELVRLLATSPNFLLLDEPTNDLDIETIELLEDFLEGFPGCVLTVSHDRAFLDRIAGFLLVFDGKGNIREFPGTYSEWKEESRVEEIEAALKAAQAVRETDRGPTKAAAGGSATEADRGAGATVAGAAIAAKKKLSFAERREFEGLLGELDGLEAEKARLEAFFSSPSPDAEELKASNRRYEEVGALIDSKTRRWEELSERA
jgi:ATP-binding cassette subfamily F protein uup